MQKANGNLMFPLWGDNSKEVANSAEFLRNAFQSPQWGDNSKVNPQFLSLSEMTFQSPQWGDNSKVDPGNHRRLI